MKDITPEALRCRFGACPAVFDLEDGRALVIGKRVSTMELFDFTQLGHFSVTDDERGVIIPREMLKGL